MAHESRTPHGESNAGASPGAPLLDAVERKRRRVASPRLRRIDLAAHLNATPATVERALGDGDQPPSMDRGFSEEIVAPRADAASQQHCLRVRVAPQVSAPAGRYPESYPARAEPR